MTLHCLPSKVSATPYLCAANGRRPGRLQMTRGNNLSLPMGLEIAVRRFGMHPILRQSEG